MAAPMTARPYTAEDLLAMGDEGAGYELIDGQIVERVVSEESSWISSLFISRLTDHVLRQRLGRVYSSDIGLHIFADGRLRRPDAAFLAKERLQAPGGGYLRVPPDLVVEVVSPGNGADELESKVAAYLAAGVRVVWVAYPATMNVHVFGPGKQAAVFEASDILTGGEVLPGFEAPVEALFGRD